MTSGSSKFWNFTWNNAAEGSYQVVSTVTAPTGNSTAMRNAQVMFRQIVVNGEAFSDNNNNGVRDAGEAFTDSNGNGVYDGPKTGDIDDDGLGLYSPGAAPIETTAIPLPTTNSETWTDGQVHIWAISGRTDPLNPDTDSDGLSDGLELGWGAAVGDTNAATDTNGDGVPNFQPDLDPPVYNTTDNGSAPSGYEYFNPWPFNLNNSRTDLIAGSITDPNKLDNDDDGLNDGFEDLRYVVVAVEFPQAAAFRPSRCRACGWQRKYHQRDQTSADGL